MDTLEQTALPDPALLIKPTRSMERGITRPQNNADADAWITLLYTLRIANPRFDKVPKKEACKWVNADSAPFLSKLYKL